MYQLFSTFSVHYPSITEYRFGRSATDGNHLYYTPVSRFLNFIWVKPRKWWVDQFFVSSLEKKQWISYLICVLLRIPIGLFPLETQHRILDHQGFKLLNRKLFLSQEIIKTSCRVHEHIIIHNTYFIYSWTLYRVYPENGFLSYLCTNK